MLCCRARVAEGMSLAMHETRREVLGVGVLASLGSLGRFAVHRMATSLLLAWPAHNACPWLTLFALHLPSSLLQTST